MDPQEIRAMIVEDLNLGDMPPESQDKIIDQFTQNVLKRITISIFEKLPEGARAEFTKLGDAGDSNGIAKLFHDNVPDLDGFIRAEVKDEVDSFKKFQAA